MWVAPHRLVVSAFRLEGFRQGFRDVVGHLEDLVRDIHSPSCLLRKADGGFLQLGLHHRLGLRQPEDHVSIRIHKESHRATQN